MTEAPKRAWFELILEDVDDEKGEAWTCYEVGLEDGDVDGTPYVRADLVDALIVAMAMEDAAQTPAEKDRAGAMRDRAMSEAGRDG